MNKRDYTVCNIIARHQVGKDIESIARELRRDVHFVGGIIGSYVTCLSLEKGTYLDTVYPETACKSNGIISAGGKEFVYCPMFRKPTSSA